MAANLLQLNLHAVLFERISGRALQLGDGLVQLGLRAKLVAARGGELRLAFEYEEDG